MDKHHHKITANERDLIAVWKGGEISLREIARRLNRSVSSISDEVKRNNYRGHYVAIHAQELTKSRIKQARIRHPLKDPDTYAYVLDKLNQGWSPELIAGRLKLKHQDTVICHETIYSFIYKTENKDKQLWDKLPWKRKKRKKKQGRLVHRGRIPDRVSIHERPKIIDNRSEFGHWEGDTVEGKGHKDGIHTEAERLSRIFMAKKVNQISSEQTILVQKQIFADMPPKARKSTTLDNGRENHLHYELKELNMNTYFADPYSSWQRGTNEFHNGLLRRYLPKKTSFADLTQEELDDIVWEINNRPRKVLNFYTPQEVFNLHLGVRILNRM